MTAPSPDELVAQADAAFGGTAAERPAAVDELELRYAALRRRLEQVGLMVDNIAAGAADHAEAAATSTPTATARYVVVDNARRLHAALPPLLLDVAHLAATLETVEAAYLPR